MILKIVGTVLMLNAALLLATPAFADGNGIKVDQVWARATPGNAKTGAIYLTITNTGTAPDTLESVSTPAADKADLHDMTMVGNVMEMRPVGPLTIAPGKIRGPGAERLSPDADRAEGAAQGRADRAGDADL